MLETIIIFFFAFIPLLVLLVITNEKISNTTKLDQLYYWVVAAIAVSILNFLIYKVLAIYMGPDESWSRTLLMVGIFFGTYIPMKFLFSMIRKRRSIATQ